MTHGTTQGIPAVFHARKDFQVSHIGTLRKTITKNDTAVIVHKIESWDWDMQAAKSRFSSDGCWWKNDRQQWASHAHTTLPLKALSFQCASWPLHTLVLGGVGSPGKLAGSHAGTIAKHIHTCEPSQFNPGTLTALNTGWLQLILLSFFHRLKCFHAHLTASSKSWQSPKKPRSANSNLRCSKQKKTKIAWNHFFEASGMINFLFVRSKKPPPQVPTLYCNS